MDVLTFCIGIGSLIHDDSWEESDFQYTVSYYFGSQNGTLM